jgi:hypothetical protein
LNADVGCRRSRSWKSAYLCSIEIIAVPPALFTCTKPTDTFVPGAQKGGGGFVAILLRIGRRRGCASAEAQARSRSKMDHITSFVLTSGPRLILRLQIKSRSLLGVGLPLGASLYSAGYSCTHTASI